MDCVEHRIAVDVDAADGRGGAVGDPPRLAVIEYVPAGGHVEGAVPVVFVHSAGVSAANWNVVAAHLGPGVKAYSLDLPGHGHSTAPFLRTEDGWRHLPTVVGELGLDRPLLVVHEHTTFVATVAVLSHPELYRGLVAVGGAVLTSTDKALEAISFVHSDGFVDTMGPRFRFGHRGIGRVAAEELITGLIQQSKDDWMTVDFGDGLRPEVERSMAYAPDGTWLHKPTMETMLGMFTLDEDDPHMPGEQFYASLAVPLWTVGLSDGFEPLSDADLDVIDAHPLMRYVEMTAGPWPQYEHPDVLARLVEAIAADPEADTLSCTPDHPQEATDDGRTGRPVASR